jgi:hypothetical protein
VTSLVGGKYRTVEIEIYRLQKGETKVNALASFRLPRGCHISGACPGPGTLFQTIST